jgi:hypothetical protein
MIHLTIMEAQRGSEDWHMIDLNAAESVVVSRLCARLGRTKACICGRESCGVDNGILEFRCGDPQPIILSPNIDLTIASSLLKYTPRGSRNSTILLDARASQNGPA